MIEHLLQAEHTDRAMRSVSHQLKAARFPLHRDLARFDFAASAVDESLVKTLATMDFTDTAQNVVFIGGPGTGKTHLATAVAVSGITSKGMRVRFYSTVDLVNQLEQEKAQRSGSANLNSALGGNSGHDAGSRTAWPQEFRWSRNQHAAPGARTAVAADRKLSHF